MKLPSSLTTVTTFSKLMAIFVFFFFVFGGVYVGMQYQYKIDYYQSKVNQEKTIIQENNVLQNKPLHKLPFPLKKGLVPAINPYLQYGFGYPSSDTLYTCPETFCYTTSQISLRVETLNTTDLPLTNPKPNLRKYDLYCSAGGADGSTVCQTTKVEDYINSLGFKGYKLYRSKSTLGIRGSSVNYDIAYVFPLSEVKKDPLGGSVDGVLFAVDIPTASNISALTTVADSFFTFSIISLEKR